MKKNRDISDKIPFAVIRKATEGEERALLAVIMHYSFYLDYYATRYGIEMEPYIDKDIRQHAVEQLIQAITTVYDITRQPCVKP